MLKSIHLCMNHARRVKRYRKLTFHQGLNVLIGPNGTGKSTILKAVMHCAECRKTEDGPTEYVLMDSETMNPRHWQSADGDYNHMILRSRALFSSHGEIMQDMFRTLRVGSQTCLLLDEPEAGQDFDHLLKLRTSMHRAVEHGAQIICATHEPLFWEAAQIIELRRNYHAQVTHEAAAILLRMRNAPPPAPAAPSRKQSSRRK